MHACRRSRRRQQCMQKSKKRALRVCEHFIGFPSGSYKREERHECVDDVVINAVYFVSLHSAEQLIRWLVGQQTFYIHSCRREEVEGKHASGIVNRETADYVTLHARLLCPICPYRQPCKDPQISLYWYRNIFLLPSISTSFYLSTYIYIYVYMYKWRSD